MKLMVFTLKFCFEKFRRINNDEDHNKYNNTNNRKNNKCNTRSNRI